MVDTVYMIGTYSTPSKKWPDKSGKDMTRDALLGALQDAGLNDRGPIASAYLSKCGMGVLWEQDLLRGHCMFAPLVEEGLFPERVPLVNLEGGCASGSMAVHMAWRDILI